MAYGFRANPVELYRCHWNAEECSEGDHVGIRLTWTRGGRNQTILGLIEATALRDELDKLINERVARMADRM